MSNVDDFVREVINAADTRFAKGKNDAYIYVDKDVIDEVISKVREKGYKCRQYTPGRIQAWQYYPLSSPFEYLNGLPPQM